MCGIAVARKTIEVLRDLHGDQRVFFVKSKAIEEGLNSVSSLLVPSHLTETRDHKLK